MENKNELPQENPFQKLENWLATKATELKHIAAHPIYYWIPSGKYNILPNSPQYRKLAQSKIQLKNILKLPL